MTRPTTAIPRVRKWGLTPLPRFAETRRLRRHLWAFVYGGIRIPPHFGLKGRSPPYTSREGRLSPVWGLTPFSEPFAGSGGFYLEWTGFPGELCFAE